MKKILFSLAAIMVMVCTAMSFVSCSSDDDEVKTVSCKVTFTVTPSDAATAQEKAILSAIETTMNGQVAMSLGEKFDLNATEVSGSLAPTTQAQQETVTKAIALSAIQECITTLKTEYGTITKQITCNLVSADGSKTFFSTTI